MLYTVYEVFPDGKKFFRFESNDRFECEVYVMMNIKAKKHIGLDDDGSVDIKTVDIPVEARKTKMEVDEKNIFRFGMGVNTEALKDTSATTSICLQALPAS